MVKLHVGYTRNSNDRWRFFASIEEAREFCDRVFRASGVVLSIVTADK